MCIYNWGHGCVYNEPITFRPVIRCNYQTALIRCTVENQKGHHQHVEKIGWTSRRTGHHSNFKIDKTKTFQKDLQQH